MYTERVYLYVCVFVCVFVGVQGGGGGRGVSPSLVTCFLSVVGVELGLVYM